MSLRSCFQPRSPSLALLAALAAGPMAAQELFPEGAEGDLYYCPRIDLVPPGEGGPFLIALDGLLDEPVWELARFQKWSVNTGGRDFVPPEEDLDLSWAAVADENYLYVAWRVVDEARITGETAFCDVWRDDSVEVYIDALNDGPVCPGGASCYGIDDAQITVGANQIGKFDPLDPDLLEYGGVAGKGACDFGAAAPELCRGVAQELESEEGFAGWQAEIAIALDTLGNGDDGTPEWHLTPRHGTTIGWNIHVNDDDNGGERDHKLLWSKREVTETAWQNPGAFGKLQFVAPGKALAVVARDLPDDLQNGGTGTVTLTVTPTFGKGIVVISEKLPASLTPSSPSEGGVLAGDTITWDLGKLEAERVLTYKLTVAADAGDVALPGTATIDGEPLAIIGDTAYTGSPISVDGFIKLWNHLGPLASGLPAGATCDPGADFGLDWIVNEDGSIGEANIRPFPGLITRPKYGGDGQPGGTGARATGLIVREDNFNKVVQDRFPVWRGSIAATETIDHASAGVNGFDAEEQVTLSCVYITNNTAAPIETNLGLGSDDSIQVFLGDMEVAQVHACRGWGNRNEEQDIAPVKLPVGESRLLVKVSDGCCASGFRLRFHKDPNDPAAGGLLPPAIALSLTSKETPPPGRVARSLSRSEFGIGETVDVSLEVSALPAADVRVREVLPAGTSADQISDGGKLDLGSIEWSLLGVAQETLSYRLSASDCAAELNYPGSSFSIGSIEAVVGGASSLRHTLRNDENLGAWDSRDLGDAAGAAERLSDHAVAVSAQGGGIKGTRDEFRFLSTAEEGDFELTARIDCLDDPGLVGQAGLMVRDTEDGHSAHAYFYVSGTPPSGGGVATLKGLFRRDTRANQGSSFVAISDKDVAAFPIHLRLRRLGTKISFHRSADGASFNEVASRDIGTGATQVNLKATALVGIAVSGNSSGSTRAAFSAVSGDPFTVGDTRTFRRGDVDANGRIDVTDPVSLLGFLFLGQGKPACLDAGDTDDSGLADISDAVANLGYQFLGAAPPAAPGPVNCGPDPGAEVPDLGCDQPCG